MKIKRFDSIEYRVIQCGNNGGYYPDGEEADRAILLMAEGVYQKNPKGNWWNTGWNFTQYGKKYYERFMKDVYAHHGHVWETRRDRDPEMYEDDTEWGDAIDTFAFSEGYHNGPRCKKCGYEFCQHCICEFDIPHCTVEEK